MVEYHGTRAELIDQIHDKYQDWAFHRWVNLWQKHQAKLHIATFDGNTEISILTDYAAVYEMKGKDLRTCEHVSPAGQSFFITISDVAYPGARGPRATSLSHSCSTRPANRPTATAQSAPCSATTGASGAMRRETPSSTTWQCGVRVRATITEFHGLSVTQTHRFHVFACASVWAGLRFALHYHVAFRDCRVLQVRWAAAGNGATGLYR